MQFCDRVLGVVLERVCGTAVAEPVREALYGHPLSNWLPEPSPKRRVRDLLENCIGNTVSCRPTNQFYGEVFHHVWFFPAHLLVAILFPLQTSVLTVKPAWLLHLAGGRVLTTQAPLGL